ncbi:GNAT family N-acetyltransferase [Terribacillus saccharophilus]|jgi:GNAT superfamily N-acetyltransferase|nr:GNAT family N-acetyltransferase [Terribacillus saccharophilus]
MTFAKVEKLPVNYKTAEDFERFAAQGNAELSMLDEFQLSLIESDDDTLFYGIYMDKELAARMALTFVNEQRDNTFYPPKGYVEISKLEVLPAYQGNRLGSSLVEFVQSFAKPVRTKARVNSETFWTRLNFKDSSKKEDSLSVMTWQPTK